MKNRSLMKCAVIGSTKIAEIHIREYVKNNFKNITIISRKKTKAKHFANLMKNKFNIKFNYSNHEIFKNTDFHIVSICSNSKFHLKHVNQIKNPNTKIIIEKPIFNIKENSKIIKTLDNIYVKKKNLFVVYPMYYLAKIFQNKFKYRHPIKNLDVYYQTRGKHIGKEIFLDLAPHVLIIMYELVKKYNLEELQLEKVIVKKNQFLFKSKFKNITLNIRLLQLPAKKKSVFKFKINNQIVKRHTSVVNNTFLNFLEFKKKKIYIDNPMSLVMKNFIENNGSSKEYKINKNITYHLMQFTKRVYETIS